MRGDRPGQLRPWRSSPEATPHARGSTCGRAGQTLAKIGYPACAGIDLVASRFHRFLPGLPRMRGDRPGTPSAQVTVRMATPHARGSTWLWKREQRRDAGYPACAGIDRTPADSS